MRNSVAYDICAKRRKGSAMAGEGGEEAEPPPPAVGTRLDIHHLPLVSTVSPPPRSPWSMVAIRNPQKHGSNDSPIIFPPVDHENLHISPDLPSTPDKIPHIHAVNQRISFFDSDSDSDSNSSSTFSPSDSSPPPRSPLFPATSAVHAAGWFASFSEILNSKVNGLIQVFCSVCKSSGGVLLTFRSAAFMAVVVAFLYFRRRRRLRAGDASRDRLIGIIKEKDEKIKQLMDQITWMNRVLLAHDKAPTP